ncbi:MAG: anhydro-N-acetylmuramic acid kinase [Gammaproteobacteria bacterium HGW-Gammaproteobacteria-3]|nr:MAG: anhydro-N-acetylmuramic acid kinase [Gammaproteobacteria bacterium HGW-Gammaproteobacteria-3]
MSGTSIDGVDAGLVDFSQAEPRCIAFEYQPFSEPLRTRLSDLTSTDQPVLLKNYGRLDVELGYLFANTVQNLLSKAELPASKITAIGSHGHTVYHAPHLDSPFSLQIGDPNIIAQMTGITTVADFRRRDIAAGGQGAPLVPAFHQAVFSSAEENRVIANIGGIANITILPKNSTDPILGFDTGPGNTLMDQWISKHSAFHYDKDGDLANSGRASQDLIECLTADPYFSAKAPKSTGKEYFSLEWLARNTRPLADYKVADVQASLCHLTAQTLCDAIKRYAPETQRVLICGGGIHNKFLMALLQQQLPCPVVSSENYGLHADHVEAVAFAWLARQTLNKLPGNLTHVTGANSSVILGGIYPGTPTPNTKG